MYKYLLWDIDGTVLDFLSSEAYAIRFLFKKYNIGECTDQMLEQYSAINVKYWKMLERGEMSKPETLIGRFYEFFEAMGIDTAIAENFNRDYQLSLGDHIEFIDVENILQSIIIVLPAGLRKKIKKLTKKTDENNIDNIIDLLCFTIEEFKSKTRYNMLKEYANLVGVDLEACGYFFTYKMSKKKYNSIMAMIESKLSVDEAPIIGKIRKIEYKIGYMKQHKKMV